MADSTCYHCGDDCGNHGVRFDDKDFCCNGCKTVYEIFTSNGLATYYEIEAKAGTTPNEIRKKYDFLDNQEIVEKLVEFNEEGVQVVSLSIPTIHCSSCIWVLENLNRLHSAITVSQVDFPQKTITFLKKGLPFFNGLCDLGIGDMLQLLLAHGTKRVKLPDDTILTPAFHND